MNLDQVALQLYTLRDHCTTPADLAATLKRVRAIGYRAVQASCICALPEEELNRMLADNGLVCCATHEPADVLFSRPEAVVERLSRLKVRYTACSLPLGTDFSDRAQVEALAKNLERAGRVLHAAGQWFCYHNHAHEFYRSGGRTVLEALLAGSAPEHLGMELDTYWVQQGGADPAAWCARLDGRLPLLHLKDFAVTPQGVPYFAEIGSGNLDFPSIIANAERSGCEWFIVEQDQCPGDPFVSIKKSFEYIAANLVENPVAA